MTRVWGRYLMEIFPCLLILKAAPNEQAPGSFRLTIIMRENMAIFLGKYYIVVGTMK